MNDKKSDETSKVKMIGHLLIRDKETGEILKNEREDFVFQKVLGNKNDRNAE